MDKELPETSSTKQILEKALYRRGYSYLKIGVLDKSKEDLQKAYEMSEGKNKMVNDALREWKQKREDNKLKEIELSKKMIGSPEKVQVSSPISSPE